MPFLLTKAKQLDRLKATITDFDVFYRLADDENGIFELIKAWRKVVTAPNIIRMIPKNYT